jgi:hypothetical protein
VTHNKFIQRFIYSDTNEPPSSISLIIRDHFTSSRNVVEKGSRGEKEKGKRQFHGKERTRRVILVYVEAIFTLNIIFVYAEKGTFQ